MSTKRHRVIRDLMEQDYKNRIARITETGQLTAEDSMVINLHLINKKMWGTRNMLERQRQDLKEIKDLTGGIKTLTEGIRDEMITQKEFLKLTIIGIVAGVILAEIIGFFLGL